MGCVYVGGGGGGVIEIIIFYSLGITAGTEIRTQYLPAH